MPFTPFRIATPSGEPAPVLIDSPHSGMEWPEDFLPAAPRSAILTTWDAFVDELWQDSTGAGATFLSANFPRAYIDANRAENDIDPALLDGEWPEPLSASDYSRRGMGLIRRLALPGVPMYERPLPVADVRRRIEVCYRPYRTALKDQLEGLHSTHGAVWHVNCHSMKSRGNEMNVDSGAARPDFVVSDRRGVTADPGITRWAAERLAAGGYTVKVNDPYLGGNIVSTFGDPAANRHSIQIEINRGLYLNEADCTRGPRFMEIKRHLAGFARAFCDLARERASNLESR